MFVEPEAAEPKGTVKTDPTAPARSTIRRQRTVRYGPHVPDHQPALSAFLARRRNHPQSRVRLPADRRSLLDDIRRRDRGALSPASRSAVEDRNIESEANQAHSAASHRMRTESGRALLRDSLSYERARRRTGIPREANIPSATGDDFPPPEFDSSGEVHSTSRPQAVRSPHTGYLPTPPYTSADISQRSSPHNRTHALGTASLTPRFAPAHRLDVDDERRANAERDVILMQLATRMTEMSDAGERERELVAGHRAEINRMINRDRAELTLEYREAEVAYLESVQTRLDSIQIATESDLLEMPLLHRTNRSLPESTRDAHQPPQRDIDGLGDRERSFSPDDDQWETMLITLQPDERVPSARSSFTSASASASSLVPNSTSSRRTQTTTPSTAPGVDVCPTESEESEDSLDELCDVMDLQIIQAQRQASRILTIAESFIRRQPLARRRTEDEDVARRRRELEIDHELQRLTANVHSLERQFTEERTHPARLPRPSGVRTSRERL